MTGSVPQPLDGKAQGRNRDEDAGDHSHAGAAPAATRIPGGEEFDFAQATPPAATGAPDSVSDNTGPALSPLSANPSATAHSPRLGVRASSPIDVKSIPANSLAGLAGRRRVEA